MKNLYKIQAHFDVDVQVEIMAETEDEAKSKLYAMDFREVVDNGVIQRADSVDETVQLAEYESVKVRVSGIHYDVNADDFYGQIEHEHPEIDYYSDEFEQLAEEAKNRTLAELPKTVEVTLKYVSPDNLKEEAVNAVTDQTGWLINGVDKVEMI